MKHSNLLLASILLIGAFILFLFGMTLMPERPSAESGQIVTDQTTPLTEPRADFADPVRGAPGGLITVFEFGDYLCGPCVDADQLLRQLITDYPTQVRIVWKDMPNESLHPGATQAAMAARCAGDQGMFWQYHDLLLKRQDGFTTDTLVPMAAELGLDLDQFQSCLTNEITKPLVTRTTEEALRLQIDATPYFFIAGRRVSGILTYDQLKGFVSAALTNAAQNQANVPATTAANR